MLDHHFRRPRVRARLRANPLGAWIEAYVDYLDHRGHAPGTIQQYVQGVEHFGVWLASEQIAIEDVTWTTIDSFLHDHLPNCQCATPSPTCLYQVRAALVHLLRVPSGRPSNPQPVSRLTPVGVILGHYGSYLRDTCGLAESTCRYRIRYAREFLQGKFGEGPVRWGRLAPKTSWLSRRDTLPAVGPARHRLRRLPCEASCDSSSSGATASPGWWPPSLISPPGDLITFRAR